MIISVLSCVVPGAASGLQLFITRDGTAELGTRPRAPLARRDLQRVVLHPHDNRCAPGRGQDSRARSPLTALCVAGSRRRGWATTRGPKTRDARTDATRSGNPRHDATSRGRPRPSRPSAASVMLLWTVLLEIHIRPALIVY